MERGEKLLCLRAEMSQKGINPLHYAGKTDNIDLLATFLSVCPDAIEDVTNQNETALHIALKYDKLDAFKLLVGWLGQNKTKNARIWERTILNWKDEEGNTVLHIAVSNNQHQESFLHPQLFSY